MEIIATLNPHNLTAEDIKGFNHREAARAVISDQEGKIALQYVSKRAYYKLPGGGVEPDETIAEALNRECLEETGCHIEVTGELGKVVEYRKARGLFQESFCYSAQLIGEKGEPDYSESEKERGFETVWVPLEEAIKLLENSKGNEEETNIIVARDLAILRKAQEVMSKK